MYSVLIVSVLVVPEIETDSDFEVHVFSSSSEVRFLSLAFLYHL